MNKKYIFWAFAATLFTSTACSGSKTQKADTNQTEIIAVNVPQFNADSAYQYVKSQVDFGPRVPNTKEHKIGRASCRERVCQYV